MTFLKKRIIFFLLSILMLVSVIPVAQAAESIEEEIIYLEDGRYLIVSTTVSLSRAANTKIGTRVITSKNADGTIDWKAVLTGTFTYNGTTATCTNSSVSVTVYASNWYEVSKTAGKSGASATGSVTMGRKVLGITVAKENYDMTLTCSPTGTLS